MHIGTNLRRSARIEYVLGLFLILTGFAFSGSGADTKASLAAISTNGLIRHIAVLSSDQFEGRAPGTAGEDLSVNYITSEFKKLGLLPGNPDGTFIQKVPLAGFTSIPTVSFTTSDKAIDLRIPNDCVAWSRRLAPTVDVKESEIVFVGY